MCTPSAAQNPAMRGDVPFNRKGGFLTNCESHNVNATASPTPSDTEKCVPM